MDGERALIRRYRGTLSYDGSAYQGFQRQKAHVPTIQAAVERAIEHVTRQAVTVSGAGRTDTGVHATGQVIAFEIVWQHDAEALLRALNANLPPDIALFSLECLPEGSTFHPRFSAASRIYRYDVISAAHRQPLFRDRAWHVRAPLDPEALAQAAALLIGDHDFGAFGQPPQGESTRRTIYRSQWAHERAANATWWRYTVEANAFLQHMVRRLVGHMLDVGRDWRTLPEFERLLQSAHIAPSWAVAPPQGLTLIEVTYTTEC